MNYVSIVMRLQTFLLGFLLIINAGLLPPLQAQEFQSTPPVICHTHNFDTFTYIAQRSANARRAPGSQIEVTYSNSFPAAAQTAFEEAVKIWEEILISRVPIKINASWESLQGTTLAFSGASRIYRNTKNTPYRDVWYVGPLAEALAGEDLNNGDADMNVSLNSNVNWSFATDGSVTAGKYDLITVVLHEIAHGLGISSSFKLINDDTQGQWGQSGFPYIYDLFIQNGSNSALTDETAFINPSAELKRQFESNNLFFTTDSPSFAENLPKINAPLPFKSGGSISHLDPGSYPSGSAESLMLPAIPSASVIHDPGQVLLTMLNQIGWPVQGLKDYLILANQIDYPILLYPNPAVTNQLNISFPEPKRNITTQIDLLDLNGRILQKRTVNTLENSTIQLDISSLESGIYFIRIISPGQYVVHKMVKL
jgi:hypothetical protein